MGESGALMPAALAFAKPALGFLGSHWKWLLIAGLVAYIAILKLSLAGEQLHSAKLSRRLSDTTAAFDRFRAEVQTKTQLAKALDEAHARRVERDQEKERADHETEIQRLRTDFAQRVRDYAKAHPGSGVRANLPGTATASVDPAPAGETAVVPVKDLEICAVNTAAAEGWLNWWKSVEAIER